MCGKLIQVTYISKTNIFIDVKNVLGLQSAKAIDDNLIGQIICYEMQI